MPPMTDRPRLRAVHAVPIEQDGNTLILLKDPLNFASPLGFSPVGYFILSHFDGQHSLVDIQQAYSRQFGEVLLTDELKRFVETLDRHHYLYSDGFIVHRNALIEDFRRRPVRAAAHAGGAYKADPAELKVQLDSFFVAPGGPGLPNGTRRTAAPRAIVSPHIDFHRGGPAYAWAYKDLTESEGADLFVLLGTSHCGGDTPFILTFKDFETPLGLAQTDKDFVARIQESCEQDLFADEYLHRGEHSLEFQVLLLQYSAQMRAAMKGGAPRPFKIVPILVSSLRSLTPNSGPERQSADVHKLLATLRDLARRDHRQVCFVAGVDLAHVGREFGDQKPITNAFLGWVESEDRKLIEHLSALDAPGFFNEIAKDEDRRRICGLWPLYALMHMLDGVAGKQLKYSQAFTPETGSAVTFTSMIFE
jgi:AmmeMemoRadiSam system protein B